MAPIAKKKKKIQNVVKEKIQDFCRFQKIKNVGRVKKTSYMGSFKMFPLQEEKRKQFTGWNPYSPLRNSHGSLAGLHVAQLSRQIFKSRSPEYANEAHRVLPSGNPTLPFFVWTEPVQVKTGVPSTCSVRLLLAQRLPVLSKHLGRMALLLDICCLQK